MTIVCISDTHGAHRQINVPEADILIHAGDFSARSSIAGLTDFNNWLGNLPHRYKIVIAGNHDSLFEMANIFARSFLTNAIYLQDSEVIIDHVKFYGSPWTPEFNHWAFMKQRGEMKYVWEKIPADVDVLITHGPPYGVLDKSGYKKANMGCAYLGKAIETIRPKLHVFGHIHEGSGVEIREQTIFINAAIMNEHYKPVNEAVLVDLRDGKVTVMDKSKTA